MNIIPNNCDAIKVATDIKFPLRPFVDRQVVDFLKVGILPGTIYCPLLEQVSSPINSDKIIYFNCKDGESIYLDFEISFQRTKKQNIIHIRDNAALLCNLRADRKRALNQIEDDKESVKKEIEKIKSEISEAAQELEKTIALINKDLSEYILSVNEYIQEISNDENKTPEEKEILIELAEDDKKFAKESAEERITYLQLSFQQEKQRKTCPQREATTISPTTTIPPVTPTPTTPNPETTTPEPTTTIDPHINRRVYLGGGICDLEEELKRIEKLETIVNGIYSSAVEEIIEESKKHYIHNNINFISFTTSIKKDKTSAIQQLEEQVSENTYKSQYLLASVYGIKKVIINAKEEEEEITELFLKDETEWKKPQLCIDFNIKNKSTKLEKNEKGIFWNFLRKNQIKDYTEIGYNFYTI